jgi:diguanylate cyclase (GGDEF) domain
MEKEESSIGTFLGKKFGGNLSLEHTIFLGGATAGIILSAFGAISNFIMGLHPIAIIIPLVNLIIDVACVVYSIKTNKWRIPALLVYIFASFVLFPFLWFTTGGTMSSSLPLVIGLGVVLAIVFHGKMRLFLFFSTLIIFSVLIIFELYFPGHFIEYPSREAWYWDVLFGFVLSYLASGGLAFYTVIKYNTAKKEAEDLIVKLDTISRTDPLTGIYNRRFLMGNLDSEMRDAYDDGRPLTLCIIDIDYFKKINDTYGHLYGDEVLIKLIF